MILKIFSGRFANLSALGVVAVLALIIVPKVFRVLSSNEKRQNAALQKVVKPHEEYLTSTKFEYSGPMGRGDFSFNRDGTLQVGGLEQGSWEIAPAGNMVLLIIVAGDPPFLHRAELRRPGGAISGSAFEMRNGSPDPNNGLDWELTRE